MKISFIDDEPQIYPLQYGGKARTILGLARSALSFEAVDEVRVMSRSISDSRDQFSDFEGVIFEKLDDHNMIGRIAEEANSADVLSVHTCSFTFPRIPAERRRAAIAYHLHDVMLTTADKGSHLDKALAGDWDVVVSPSNFASKTYENFAAQTGGSADIRTIPRGIDFNMFHEVSKEESVRQLRKLGVDIDDKTWPIIFFPGRANVGKGDDHINQICEFLAVQYPDFRVVTASDPDSAKSHPNVLHAGWQESPNLKYFYSIADITLVPSRLPESFSQVCLESVACGTPVLAFPFGNLRDLSESLPAVLTCDPTIDSMIDGVSRLLVDPDVSDRLSASQDVLRANYSIEEIGKVYIQLYMDIVRNQREKLRIPELYFISPFVIERDGKVYISNNDNLPLKAHTLSGDETMVLSYCRNAVSIDDLQLLTKLNRETLRATLCGLEEKKIIIGGSHG